MATDGTGGQDRRRQTPKQVLATHIEERHGGFASERGDRFRERPATSWTMDRLAQWHARQHHQRWTNHRHEGANIGPGDRPPGWRTGEGVVDR